MRPEFSIIMPSYLLDYRGAAKDREDKFERAVDSVIDQSFEDWELIIISDGCDVTVKACLGCYGRVPKIGCYRIPKSELWCPSVRNAGLTKAIGKWMIYLDTDDYFGPSHLKNIAAQLKDYQGEWAWFDALIPRKDQWIPMQADITKCARHGTANIVHRPGPLWPTQMKHRGTGELDYSTQDCTFTDALKKLPGGEYIGVSEYHICHLPNRFDV